MDELKTKNISLYELGQEYEKCAQLQQSIIESCKHDIKRAKEIGDRDAVFQLEQKLYKLREIKNEISQTASKLKKYYNLGESCGK